MSEKTVQMQFTLEELKAIANGLATMEEDYGDTTHHELYVRVSEEIDVLEIELESATVVPRETEEMK